MRAAIKSALRPAYRLAKRAFVPDRPRTTSVAPVALDEFMAWMGFITPGMLVHSNLELFAHCIARLPSEAPIIEIGSFAGRSLNYLIHFLRLNTRHNAVYSVDEWHFEGADLGSTIGASSVRFDDYRKHVIETFRSNIMLFSADRLPHHMSMSSDDFFAAWQEKQHAADFFGRPVSLGGPVSFVYIDGDHSYHQSKRDFENADRHLERGGFIVFDDSGTESGFESTKTAQQAAKLSRYELVANNPNYCIRKI
jgi:hypothetical protein